MVGRQKDGIVCTMSQSVARGSGKNSSRTKRAERTEVEGIEDPFVEQNDRRTQADPDTVCRNRRQQMSSV